MDKSRRTFVKKAISGSVATGIAPSLIAHPLFFPNKEKKRYAANDKIRIAGIGMGIMGFNHCKTLAKIEGAELVAACDLYKGRLERVRELYGKEIRTTADYQEILNRDDIDAVFIATTDHWHDKIAIAAMEAGKAVYCEKPMVHKLEEGLAIIKKQKETKQVFQVGSQSMSGQVYAKAKELYKSGVLGKLIMAEAWYDRQSANGAWQYSIPPDASEKTISWDRFLGDAPKVPFDPVRFFRWRNYRDYGTGVAGDLYVHLFTGIHFVLDSKGPERIYATGGLRYWEDGRDVPDVIIGAFDYPKTETHPAFNLQLRTNFVDGGGGGSKVRLIGSEGLMEISGSGVVVKRNVMGKAPGYGGWDSFDTFSERTQKEFVAQYKKEYPESLAKPLKEEMVYDGPKGDNPNKTHFEIFFDAMRKNTPIIQDASFGLRAAGPSLCANLSYFNKKVINWDPEKMIVVD